MNAAPRTVQCPAAESSVGRDTEPSPSEITTALDGLQSGDAWARERFLRLVYDDLLRIPRGQMRGERRDHTLQATALVNEAYLRLFRRDDVQWSNRRQFFAAAAEVMRRVLIDHARERLAAKRRGDRTPLAIEEEIAVFHRAPEQLLAINEALTELETEHPDKAQLVKMRFFAGLTLEEIAAALGMSHSTVKREWRFARAWLMNAFGDLDAPED